MCSAIPRRILLGPRRLERHHLPKDMVTQRLNGLKVLGAVALEPNVLEVHPLLKFMRLCISWNLVGTH